MKRESVVSLLAGTMFGLLVGWILGSQQAAPVIAPQSASAQPATGQGATPQAPPPLDTVKANELQKRAEADPANAAVRVELANLFLDADRFDQAIPWFEAALKIDPKNVNASADLGVSYYYSNQLERALAQFDKALAIDPKHAKTLLNQGIVLAFGKQDLKGAEAAWQKVVAAAPGTDEARKAQQGLDGLRAAHGKG